MKNHLFFCSILDSVLFSFCDKTWSTEEDKDPEESNISLTGTLFFFSVQGM